MSFLCSILFHSRSEILLLDFRILHLPECRVPHFIQHKNPEDPIRISFMRDAIRRIDTVFEKSGKSLIQWNYEYLFKIQQFWFLKAVHRDSKLSSNQLSKSIVEWDIWSDFWPQWDSERRNLWWYRKWKHTWVCDKLELLALAERPKWLPPDPQ